VWVKSKKNGNCFSYDVVSYKECLKIIIPFLNKYPLLGTKLLNYQDFCKIAELMQDKVHLTQEGLEQIRQIKSGMNSKRDPDS